MRYDGIPCWYAPRNIPTGAIFESAIVEAIRPSPLLVLIFSSHSNASEFVKREIQNAHKDGLKITVIPFRVENIEYNETLQFYLHSLQWFDASTPPVEEHLPSLVKQVRERLKLGPGPSGSSRIFAAS